MSIRARGIPKTHRYTGSRAQLKRTFGDIAQASIHMGSLFPRFMFDPRCPRVPTLQGTVIASAQVSRELTAIIQLYSIPKTAYPDAAAEEFSESILPRMRRWLLGQLSKPSTGILSYEELIVEWTGAKHREHTLRFL